MKRKRIWIVLLLAASLLLPTGAMGYPANAPQPPAPSMPPRPVPSWYKGSLATTFPGAGAGTAADPYLIETPEHLAWIGDLANSAYLDKHYKVIADIIAPRDLIIAPNGNYAFKGVFDGNSHRITISINANNQYYVGLFGYMGQGGRIERLTVAGTVRAATSSADGAYSLVGGIVGYNRDGGTVVNCYSTVAVSISSDSPSSGGTPSLASGVVGYNFGTVSNCAASGRINAMEIRHVRVGGLVGDNGSSGEVKNSYATGDVSSGYAGGLVGYNRGTIRDSYATGKVSAPHYAGGLVVWNLGTVRNGYATGDVFSSIGNNSTSGLIGNSYPRSELDSDMTDSGVTDNIVIDSVALNARINTGAAGYSPRRVQGDFSFTSSSALTLSNNYAITSMLLNGSPFTGTPGRDNPDGADADASTHGTQALWQVAMPSWDFTNVWAWGSGNVPILRNMPGGDSPQSHSIAWPAPVAPVEPIVTGVTIDPLTFTVAPNGRLTFTATVQGTGNPAQVVEWFLYVQSPGILHPDTAINRIDDNHAELVVHQDQGPATLTVTATASGTAISDTATVVIP